MAANLTGPQNGTAESATQLSGAARQHFDLGNFTDAARLYDRALAIEESAERWNDWATVQLACGHDGESERGFRRALRINPFYLQAAANLGVLLVKLDRRPEAVPFLKQAAGIDDQQRPVVLQLLAACGGGNPLVALPMDIEEVKRKLASVRWHHRFQIAPGIETPGKYPIDAAYYLDCLRVPRDLRGKRAIDIGTYDGPIAFELEKRGADVVALDIHDPNRSGFGIARELLGSRVPYIQAQRGVYDLPEAVGRQFDLVFFLGVFYHLKSPIEAFEHIARIMHAESRLYFEGETLYRYAEDAEGHPVVSPLFEQLSTSEIPLTLCYPGTFVQASNWFIPNVACLKGWLKAAGFEILDISSMSFPEKIPPQQRTAGIARKMSDTPMIEHDLR